MKIRLHPMIVFVALAWAPQVGYGQQSASPLPQAVTASQAQRCLADNAASPGSKCPTLTKPYRVSLDMWDLLRYATISVEVGVGLSPKSEVGGIVSWGRPNREIFERFSVTRIGGLYNYFVLGDRLDGVGIHGSLRYVYGQGDGSASDSDQTLSAKSHALHAEASLILRATMKNGPQIEARLGLRWLSSYAEATLSGQNEQSQLHTLMVPVTVHAGWAF